MSPRKCLFRVALGSALVLGSLVLPLVGCVALQYDGGAAALALLAGAHLLLLAPVGRLVDFGGTAA